MTRNNMKAYLKPAIRVMAMDDEPLCAASPTGGETSPAPASKDYETLSKENDGGAIYTGNSHDIWDE